MDEKMVVFKVNLEEVYDHIGWDFLDHPLVRKGLLTTWKSWIRVVHSQSPMLLSYWLCQRLDRGTCRAEARISTFTVSLLRKLSPTTIVIPLKSSHKPHLPLPVDMSIQHKILDYPYKNQLKPENCAHYNRALPQYIEYSLLSLHQIYMGCVCLQSVIPSS